MHLFAYGLKYIGKGLFQFLDLGPSICNNTQPVCNLQNEQILE